MEEMYQSCKRGHDAELNQDFVYDFVLKLKLCFVYIVHVHILISNFM